MNRCVHMYATLCYLYNLYTCIYMHVYPSLSANGKMHFLGVFSHHPRYMGHGWSRFGRELPVQTCPNPTSECPTEQFWISYLKLHSLRHTAPGQVRELPSAIRSFSFKKPNHEDTKCQHSHLNIIFAKTMKIAQQTANMPPGKYGRTWQNQVVRPRASKNARSGKHFMPGLRRPGHLWTSIDIDIYHGFNPADILGVPSHARLNIKAV